MSREILLLVDALAREKTDKVRSMLLDSVQPLPLVDVVKAWHGRRPMSVGTGSESAIAEALLAHLGLRRYFDAVVAADHVQHHKPAPDTFCFVPNVWGLFRLVASCLKMPILEYRRRMPREWMPWMSGYCE